MDQYSLSVRRQAAHKRIRVAVTKLAGEEASANLEVGHKDSRVDEVLRLEAIADVLEQLPSAPPATPAADHSRIFSKADGLYIVDDAGAVTGPFASAAGGGYTQNVRVHMSTDQNVSNGTITPVSFDTEDWDTDGIHESVMYPTRLTCKTAGKYNVYALMVWPFNATGIRYLFKVNGTTAYYVAVVYAINDPVVQSKAAYLAKVLTNAPADREQVPEPFTQFATLPIDTWVLFAQTTWQQRHATRRVTPLPAGLQHEPLAALYHAWCSVYGDSDPRELPLGVGPAMADWLIRQPIDQETDRSATPEPPDESPPDIPVFAIDEHGLSSTALWQQVCQELALSVASPLQARYVQPTCLANLDQHVAQIAAPTADDCDWHTRLARPAVALARPHRDLPPGY